MKKILPIILFAVFFLQGFSREIYGSLQETKKQQVSANKNENDSIVAGKETKSSEIADTTLTLKVGDRNLRVLETLEGQRVTFEKTDPLNEAEEAEKWISHDEYDDHHRHSRKYSFKGHWADIEFGFNNYLGPDKSIVLPEDINYMTLHSSKSTNFTINFAQLSLGFSDHAGLVTGLGMKNSIRELHSRNQSLPQFILRFHFYSSFRSPWRIIALTSQLVPSVL
jgi:ABC-type multidrug transport system fused ATPase/permease subunit